MNISTLDLFSSSNHKEPYIHCLSLTSAWHFYFCHTYQCDRGMLLKTLYFLCLLIDGHVPVRHF